jgi:hypothetical protein
MLGRLSVKGLYCHADQVAMIVFQLCLEPHALQDSGQSADVSEAAQVLSLTNPKAS